MSIQRALLLVIAVALFAGIAPAGVAIDRRLAREVVARSREELSQAPRFWADRSLGQADAILMHAKDVARAPGLAEAMQRGDKRVALTAAEMAREHFGDASVLVTASESVWSGPSPGKELLESVRRGAMPTTIVSDSGQLYMLALVSVARGNTWLGVAGVSVALNRAMAGILAGLTRSEVIIVDARGALVASTADDSVTPLLVEFANRAVPDGIVRPENRLSAEYLVTAVPAGSVGRVVFIRDLTRDLAALPAFRRVVIFSSVAAVLIGLLMGTLLARRISSPVMALADAADRLAAGDEDAPVPVSKIHELQRLSQAFVAMRQALSLRISTVTGANRRLTDRQTRFESSQTEILQRERLATSARLAAGLAHEIRNPIANVRNCLEVVRRRVSADPQAKEFTDLAIDELLRMHELAEQLLDLSRPRDPGLRVANVDVVVHEVVVLASAAWAPGRPAIHVSNSSDIIKLAAIAPDALKQVLLNLLQNAREALTDYERKSAGPPAAEPESAAISIETRLQAGHVFIDVADNGPGIPSEIVPHIFDPFFTTKGAVQGVGLGLFIAEGLMRSAGGRISVQNRETGGVIFQLELPAAVATLLPPEAPKVHNSAVHEIGPSSPEV